MSHDNEEYPKAAYRYAIGIYLVFSTFYYYIIHSALLFIAKNFAKADASGFSIQNPNFATWNIIISLILTFIILIISFLNSKLKAYILDVGDELTRVSWTSMHEAGKSTVIILALTLVSALFLFFTDQFLNKLMVFLLK